MVILALSVLNMEMMRFDSLRSGTSVPSGFPVSDLKKPLFCKPQSVIPDIKSKLYLPTIMTLLLLTIPKPWKYVKGKAAYEPVSLPPVHARVTESTEGLNEVNEASFLRYSCCYLLITLNYYFTIMATLA